MRRIRLPLIGLALAGCLHQRSETVVASECVSMPTVVGFASGRRPDAVLQSAGQASLTVVVLNSLAMPVAHAHVSVDSGAAGFTNAAGEIALAGLPAKMAQVFVYVPESQSLWSQRLQVQLAAGYQDTVRVYLASGRLGIPCGVR